MTGAAFLLQSTDAANNKPDSQVPDCQIDDPQIKGPRMKAASRAVRQKMAGSNSNSSHQELWDLQALHDLQAIGVKVEELLLWAETVEKNEGTEDLLARISRIAASCRAMVREGDPVAVREFRKLRRSVEALADIADQNFLDKLATDS